MCGNMLFMDPQKSWLLIGRAKLISTNGPSFTFCTQPLKSDQSFLEQLFSDCGEVDQYAQGQGLDNMR